MLCWCTGATLLKLSRERIVRDEPETWAVAMAAAQGSGTNERQDCASDPWCGPYFNCCCLASRLLKAFERTARQPDAEGLGRRFSYSVLRPLRSSSVAPSRGGDEAIEAVVEPTPLTSSGSVDIEVPLSLPPSPSGLESRRSSPPYIV